MAGPQQQHRARGLPVGSDRVAGAIPASLHRLADLAGPVVASAPTTPDVTAFVEALSADDEQVAVDFLQSRLTVGVPADALVLDLLAPAAREVGRRWEGDDCDFVSVTLALGRLQRMLRGLSPRLTASGPSIGPIPGTICVACLPDEQHTFGASVCAEFFARDGWQVMMGAPLSRTDTIELVRRTSVDVVALSVSRSPSFPAVTRMVSRLRRASSNRQLTILIGGPMAPHVAETAGQLGADAVLTDLGDAIRLARNYATDRSPAPRPTTRDLVRLR